MTRYSHVLVMGGLNSDLFGLATYAKTNLKTKLHWCNMTIQERDATNHNATWFDIMDVSDPIHDVGVHNGQLHAPGLSKHDLIFLVYTRHLLKSNLNLFTIVTTG